ncbi:Anoctamin-1, partial [Cichlidogyrus casuarinus]
VRDVCEAHSDFIMCPKCKGCNFWTLGESCLRMRMSRMLDHYGTVIFSIFICLWCTVFMEMWKRQQYRLAYRWDVHELLKFEEPPRPEFITLIGKKYPPKKERIPNESPEPDIPFWKRKMPVYIFSLFVIFGGVALCLGCVIGIMFFKIHFAYIFRSSNDALLSQYGNLIASLLGTLISIVFLQILSILYRGISIFLTNLELHRTQTEYDAALTLKLSMLQFCNYYSVVFYAAFVQGPTAAVPGDPGNLTIQQYGCDAGDCLFELFPQMAVILVVKQISGSLVEAILPFVFSIMNRISFFNSGENIERRAIEKELKKERKLRKQEKKLAEQSGATAAAKDQIGELVEQHNNERRWRTTLAMCKANLALYTPKYQAFIQEYLEMSKFISHFK